MNTGCKAIHRVKGGHKTSAAVAASSLKCKIGSGGASAAVSLVTGSMAASVVVNRAGLNEAFAGFAVDGEILLPRGMTSAPLVFGTSGTTVSGAAGANSAYAYNGDITFQNLLGAGLISDCFIVANGVPTGGPKCPGLGRDLRVSTTVFNFEDIALSGGFGASASANLGPPPGSAEAAISDPLFLSLPPGARFVSSVPGFLSGPATVPEPFSALLLGSGLLSTATLLRRRRRAQLCDFAHKTGAKPAGACARSKNP